MSETRAEEIERLQREIAERQIRLVQLVCGDLREGVIWKTAINPWVCCSPPPQPEVEQ